MTIRKILTEPDPFLRQKSKPVEKVDDSIREIMDDMLETMYQAPGIGLAAIQIGIPKRIIVLDISKDREKKNHCILLIQKKYIHQKIRQPTKKAAYPFQDNSLKLIDQINVILNIWIIMVIPKSLRQKAC